MQHPEAELSINMSKKQVCLYQWDYIINYNEKKKKNDDSKIVHVNETYRPSHRHRDKYRKYDVFWKYNVYM